MSERYGKGVDVHVHVHDYIFRVYRAVSRHLRSASAAIGSIPSGTFRRGRVSLSLSLQNLEGRYVALLHLLSPALIISGGLSHILPTIDHPYDLIRSSIQHTRQSGRVQWCEFIPLVDACLSMVPLMPPILSSVPSTLASPRLNP